MSKKILVVDDEVESVKLIGLLLQRRGYEIVAARSGVQALEKVRLVAAFVALLYELLCLHNGLSSTISSAPLFLASRAFSWISTSFFIRFTQKAIYGLNQLRFSSAIIKQPSGHSAQKTDSLEG